MLQIGFFYSYYILQFQELRGELWYKENFDSRKHMKERNKERTEGGTYAFCSDWNSVTQKVAEGSEKRGLGGNTMGFLFDQSFPKISIYITMVNRSQC